MDISGLLDEINTNLEANGTKQTTTDKFFNTLINENIKAHLLVYFEYRISEVKDLLEHTFYNREDLSGVELSKIKDLADNITNDCLKLSNTICSSGLNTNKHLMNKDVLVDMDFKEIANIRSELHKHLMLKDKTTIENELPRDNKILEFFAIATDKVNSNFNQSYRKSLNNIDNILNEEETVKPKNKLKIS